MSQVLPNNVVSFAAKKKRRNGKKKAQKPKENPAEPTLTPPQTKRLLIWIDNTSGMTAEQRIDLFYRKFAH